MHPLAVRVGSAPAGGAERDVQKVAVANPLADVLCAVAVADAPRLHLAFGIGDLVRVAAGRSRFRLGWARLERRVIAPCADRG